jgi:hypothetical protein
MRRGESEERYRNPNQNQSDKREVIAFHAFILHPLQLLGARA